jgi:signal transduction histidine kinase/CheY-like chemotaxis protein/HAMP domain-containing protein
VAREVGVRGRLGGQARVPGAAGTWRALTDNVNQLAANLTTQVRAIAEVATAVTKGDLTRSIAVEAQGEVAALKDNINEMIGNLKDTTSKNSEQDWLKTNLAKFTRMLQGQKDLLTVGRLILSELAATVDAQHGCFFMMETNPDGETELHMLASYAYTQRKHIGNRFRLGEGLVGQAAFEKDRILLTDVPSNYVEINSGLGAATPLNIVVLPVLFEGKVKAVIELASFHRFETTQLTFLDQLMESIGIVLNTIEANMRTESLLEQSQSLAKELQSQQNELQQKNEELEEKARLLASQNVEVERQNQEIELARRALEDKASQLALTSKYKSEFLANMSHELRTPLNSLLILADQLASNADLNLSERQVEYAQTIHASGNDLLRLINDILDLAKIESGTVVLDIARVSFRDVAGTLERTFRPVAESKGLAFEITIDPVLPPLMRTDAKRLLQVLKNLASNALKFTERGGVTLRAAPAAPSWSGALGRSVRMVQFEVRDTGIGVPASKQNIIFEAFQQADGSTSRRYGGTGLGLTISREIARLLGGDIGLVSASGMGSTFTLYLPLDHEPAPPRSPDGPRVTVRTAGGPTEIVEPAEPQPEILGDPAEEIAKGEPVFLHVGEDAMLARQAIAAGRGLGLKCLVATRPALAMEYAQRFRPRVIALDVSLPEVDGWRLLRIFKSDPATRAIPLLLLTAGDDRVHALRLGAAAHLATPADRATLQQSLSKLLALAEREKRRLLVIKQDQKESDQIARMIGNGNVVTVTATSGREGLAKLEMDAVDCVILDPALADMNLSDFLREMRDASDERPPIVVYPGVDADFEDARSDPKTMDAVVRGAPTPESLLEDALLFLHYPPEPFRDVEHELVERASEDLLLGHRRVLVVDDDVRNLFALTSLLERHGMEVSTAETGMQALQRLESRPTVDIILMDVMMPDMDGYETMRAIRRSPSHGQVPIVAVTAKAMKGDREKCLEAGASDYVAKPIDSTRLLSAMKVWLCR